MDEKSVGVIMRTGPPTWKVFIDGAANQKGYGIGLVLISPEGITFKKSLRLAFSATNNEAEYEAVLVGMNMVYSMGGKGVHMLSDSQLVVSQVTGTMEVRDSRMQEYLTQVKSLQSKFDSFILSHVSRNLLEPALATVGAPRIHLIRFGPSWIDPVISFLKNDVLPEDKSEADKIRQKAPRFWLSKD
ncbi:uncharacterized protein LOC142643965 [Castanea sativa]|uniref:uncharacterized protein LOC142643965 n=1 Tax=Castanea sativa TaxID=21020 RepID=UPI003F649DB9